MKQSSRKAKLTAKIEKENQRSRILVFTLLGLFVLAAGWLIFRPLTRHMPTVLSLQDKWELLESSAHEWQSDSYVTDVTFDVNRKSPYQISAEYHSASAPGILFFVGIDNSGEINALPFDNLDSAAQEPVYRQDWAIDSQEALNIFAKDEIVSSCLKTSRDPISMSLNRVSTDMPTWELNIFNCPEDGKFKSYYLNAKTGELIDPFKP